MSRASNRIPNVPPQSLPTSSNAFLSQMSSNLLNASSLLPTSSQSNFLANLPSTSFVNQMQYQPPTIDYPTQQFSLTSTFPCSSTSIVANNTSLVASVVNTRYNSNALLITNYFLSNFDGNFFLISLK